MIKPTDEEMQDALEETGFEVISMAEEGGIDVSGGKYPPKPFLTDIYGNRSHAWSCFMKS